MYVDDFLTEVERNKLANLASDPKAVEALNKLFALAIADALKMEINNLQAAGKAIDLVNKGFNKLSLFEKQKKQDNNRSNPAV